MVGKRDMCRFFKLLVKTQCINAFSMDGNDRLYLAILKCIIGDFFNISYTKNQNTEGESCIHLFTTCNSGHQFIVIFFFKNSGI